MLTHPVSDPLPLPSTPVALDAASRSSKTIAEIKGRAYANGVPFEFNETPWIKMGRLHLSKPTDPFLIRRHQCCSCDSEYAGADDNFDWEDQARV